MVIRLRNGYLGRLAQGADVTQVGGGTAPPHKLVVILCAATGVGRSSLTFFCTVVLKHQGERLNAFSQVVHVGACELQGGQLLGKVRRDDGCLINAVVCRCDGQEHGLDRKSVFLPGCGESQPHFGEIGFRGYTTEEAEQLTCGLAPVRGGELRGSCLILPVAGLFARDSRLITSWPTKLAICAT